MKDHPWFSDIDWNRLNLKVETTVCAVVEESLDTSMDPYDESDHVQQYKGDNEPFATF